MKGKPNYPELREIARTLERMRAFGRYPALRILSYAYNVVASDHEGWPTELPMTGGIGRVPDSIEMLQEIGGEEGDRTNGPDHADFR